MPDFVPKGSMRTSGLSSNGAQRFAKTSSRASPAGRVELEQQGGELEPQRVRHGFRMPDVLRAGRVGFFRGDRVPVPVAGRGERVHGVDGP